ncbi:MAG: hypothetical protein QOI53_3154 [Verrucomicrobiota bacterium]|nr:hypothetical protein [Verrucomicrobiota bacterium]
MIRSWTVPSMSFDLGRSIALSPVTSVFALSFKNFGTRHLPAQDSVKGMRACRRVDQQQV